MGLVTDVSWVCPGCGAKNISQIYGEHTGFRPLDSRLLPSNARLKWNPPCEGCGNYQLREPEVELVSFPIHFIRSNQEN